MPPIKLAHIIPTFDSGGAERLVLEYARRLPERGYEVHVVSVAAGGSLGPSIADTPSRVFVGSRQEYGGRIGAFRAVQRYLDQARPDIVHTHLISSDAAGYWWTRRHRRARWVATMHNVEAYRPWHYRALWRQMLPRSDAVVAVSGAVREYALGHLRAPDKTTFTILNGIDTGRWLAVPAAGLFSQGTVRIATIGRLHRQKGHGDALDALSGLKHLPWEYHLFGEGDERGPLQALAGKLGIAERVRWHGVSLDLPAQIAAMDIVVQPSLWEGLSLTVMEAMAAGRCVVASEPAGRELINPGVDGWIVPTHQPEALRERLAAIFSAPDKAKAAAVQARQSARSRFGMDRHLNQLDSLYRSLL